VARTSRRWDARLLRISGGWATAGLLSAASAPVALWASDNGYIGWGVGVVVGLAVTALSYVVAPMALLVALGFFGHALSGQTAEIHREPD
jgi:hypothetical protein